jgi:DNA-binding Lrp family transcriptional regulator
MDPADLRLLQELEHGLEPVPAPFAAVGRRIGMTEDEVIRRVRDLRERGVIRKFRARIDQRKAGITANALVAWKPSGDIADCGERLAAYPSVTHCYERRTIPGRWEYRYYTVHHGYSRVEVLEDVARIARESGCPEYLVLFSTREFKRVPNVRIRENGGGA